MKRRFLIPLAPAIFAATSFVSASAEAAVSTPLLQDPHVHVHEAIEPPFATQKQAILILFFLGGSSRSGAAVTSLTPSFPKSEVDLPIDHPGGMMFTKSKRWIWWLII
ncbi:hypothetical protein [Microvirga sp. CF3016]|uniref:hypothetical protein n=1 Tax=Microvirga sp. CF3016 TaxID=3110181 RepID=UPI002E76E3E9|nr:hypothetical protein [Microvirga sp. CF3016]MEE1611119.1 hypothetical protein [Microvirga sp. CF3016]